MQQITRMIIQVGGRKLSLSGRKAWALAALIDAGERGVTPIEHVGPRWSDYIFKLRRDGLVIESQPENHGGPFAGHHSRYVLRSEVIEIERHTGDRRAA